MFKLKVSLSEIHTQISRRKKLKMKMQPKRCHELLPQVFLNASNFKFQIGFFKRQYSRKSYRMLRATVFKASETEMMTGLYA